jgi:hypothetical protein
MSIKKFYVYLFLLLCVNIFSQENIEEIFYLNWFTTPDQYLTSLKELQPEKVYKAHNYDKNNNIVEIDLLVNETDNIPVLLIRPIICNQAFTEYLGFSDNFGYSESKLKCAAIFTSTKEGDVLYNLITRMSQKLICNGTITENKINIDEYLLETSLTRLNSIQDICDFIDGAEHSTMGKILNNYATEYSNNSKSEKSFSFELFHTANTKILVEKNDHITCFYFIEDFFQYDGCYSAFVEGISYNTCEVIINDAKIYYKQNNSGLLSRNNGKYTITINNLLNNLKSYTIITNQNYPDRIFLKYSSDDGDIYFIKERCLAKTNAEETSTQIGRSFLERYIGHTLNQSNSIIDNSLKN